MRKYYRIYVLSLQRDAAIPVTAPVCTAWRCTQEVEGTALEMRQVGFPGAWVRLPPSAPKAAPCGVLFSVFIASFARWDSNSPCPALCAPPGCKNPVGCCKGAGTPIICTISDVESKDFTADALGGFSGATTPSSVGESKKDYIVKRSSGIMKVRSANCTNKIPGGL